MFNRVLNKLKPTYAAIQNVKEIYTDTYDLKLEKS